MSAQASLPATESSDGKPKMGLKRGKSLNKFARKKPKMGKDEEEKVCPVKQEDIELELDEKVVDSCEAKLEPRENISINLKAGEVSETLPLHTGARIPTLQFGSYKLKGLESFEATLSALKQGYRGVDTATCYDNEKQVGQAIVASGLKREELFVQTKLWRSYSGIEPKSGKPRCDTWLRKSLKLLGIAKLDLWLMHWPGPGRHLNYPPVKMGMERPKLVKSENASRMAPMDWTPATRLQTYRLMAKHVPGTVAALGVCNFSARQLTELLVFCKDNRLPRPAVVQNECHPYLPARQVRAVCKENGIVFQAYASLGAGMLPLLNDSTITSIASRLSVSPGQVLLRWGLQQGVALLPKSCKAERQKQNLEVWHFSLSAEDLALIAKLDRSQENQNTMAGWLREHDPDFY